MAIATNNNAAYLGFNCFTKIGPVRIKKLLAYFPDVTSAFQGSVSDLTRAGLEESLISEFIAWRRSFCAPKMQEQLIKEDINFISWEDPNYPKILLEIAVPPPSFYYRGRLDCLADNRALNNHNLAVVGSRQSSAYAAQVIAVLLPPLISAGLRIVSGLALGVDTLAHQAALDQQGSTWAILGSGLRLNNIYPQANRGLAEKIVAQGGALLSEFPPEYPPFKQNFPRRNRLIAGLSAATLVIEAGHGSGALITARHALEEGREILAIPGNIFSELSAGPNSLIKAGAKAISQPEEILETFNLAELSREQK